MVLFWYYVALPLVYCFWYYFVGIICPDFVGTVLYFNAPMDFGFTIEVRNYYLGRIMAVLNIIFTMPKNESVAPHAFFFAPYSPPILHSLKG